MRTGSAVTTQKQRWLACLFLILLGESLVTPRSVSAQVQVGQNAVFSTTNPTNTSAFIDAANFSSGGDLCAKIHAVLISNTTYIQKTNWQTIDARGVSNLGCTTNPWSAIPSGHRDWVTVLLPAGTIQISAMWTLPKYTRIIGQGRGITTLQAATGFSGRAMIAMGCLDTTCGLSFAVSVENLTLDTNSLNIDGIQNSDAEEQSYVKHVQMINVGGSTGGTGLVVSVDLPNSSKTNHSTYSDLSVTTTGTGSCVNILSVTNAGTETTAQPRAIHGLNCTCMASGSACSSSNTNAGIYLDGSNVTLESITVNGFGDGIRIGSQQPVQSNVIFNVAGGSNVNDVVHICGPNNGGNGACAQTSNAVSDLTLMGITGAANNTIQDDVTETLLLESSDPTVSMYILGEPVTIGSNTGYSRFTTSPSLPTWRVGTAKPPVGNCGVGSLYSRTSNTITAPPTIYGCSGSGTGSSGSWTQIK